MMSQQPTSLPLDLLSSGQVLSISQDCQGWLILQKPFYAEFVGPGAAVGGSFDIQCKSIYTIGTVQFDLPADHGERRKAFQHRIEYIQRIQDILLEDAPISRADKLIHQLCAWVGLEDARGIPLEIAARLIGVMPKNIEIAWNMHPDLQRSATKIQAVLA
jgi:hypothetical protein